MAERPEISTWFNRTMRDRTAALLDAGMPLYDWPGTGTVVDVGGGNGLLLERLLAERPGLRGVVFDQPHVVAEAEERLAAAGHADRVTLAGGDFFDAVPEGGNVYVLASVLHDGPTTMRQRSCAPAGGRWRPRRDSSSSSRSANWTRPGWQRSSTCTCWCCAGRASAPARSGTTC